MQVERQSRRVAVDIPVTITTVLDSFDAAIVDLSEQGARISGHSVPEGQRFRIDYMGQAIFAQCCWAEVDRMGIQFLFPLTDGPLYERLMVARTSRIYDDSGAHMGSVPGLAREGRAVARAFSRSPLAAQFGRRN